MTFLMYQIHKFKKLIRWEEKGSFSVGQWHAKDQHLTPGMCCLPYEAILDLYLTKLKHTSP